MTDNNNSNNHHNHNHKDNDTMYSPSALSRPPFLSSNPRRQEEITLNEYLPYHPRLESTRSKPRTKRAEPKHEEKKAIGATYSSSLTNLQQLSMIDYTRSDRCYYYRWVQIHGVVSAIISSESVTRLSIFYDAFRAKGETRTNRTTSVM